MQVVIEVIEVRGYLHRIICTECRGRLDTSMRYSVLTYPAILGPRHREAEKLATL